MSSQGQELDSLLLELGAITLQLPHLPAAPASLRLDGLVLVSPCVHRDRSHRVLGPRPRGVRREQITVSIELSKPPQRLAHTIHGRRLPRPTLLLKVQAMWLIASGVLMDFARTASPRRGAFSRTRL